MKGSMLHTILAVIFCVITSVTLADTLIYNNANYAGYFTPGYNYEIFDYGTSPGGYVSKFTFGYQSTSVTPTVLVRFYQSISTYYYETGYLIKQVQIDNLPSTGGSVQFFTYVLPEADRFTLSNGLFGYSITVYSSSTNLAIASGGTGQVDELWEYYYDWLYGWGWYPFGFSNAWAGLYMKIYTGPPIDAITCDISGYKFNDSNGNGARDAGESYLPGWEMYADTNDNDQYDAGVDPNAATDPNGMYFFENLPSPATYTIREVLLDGWTQTLPGGPNYEYTIATEPNHLYGPCDFGNVQWAGSQITLSPIADTYADQATPDTNFGSSNSFTAGMDGSMEHVSFIKFDLSSIPEGMVIVSAKLQLDGSFVSIPAPILGAHRCSSSWEEDTLTWNDMPSVSNLSGSLIEEKTPVIDITEWDVTDYADDEYISFQDDLITIALKKYITSPSGARASFWSKDMGVPDLAPKLVIQYEPMFGGGTGDRSDPYQIKTGEHMNTIGSYNNRWDKHYKLMNDISLVAYSGTLYNIIGRSRSTTNGLGAFTGTFDGGYHQISGFSYSDASGVDYVGLFGYVYQATLRNIIITNQYVV